MATLSFLPSAEQDNMLEATFTAQDSNVLQYHITQAPVPTAFAVGSTPATNVFIHARISPDMPWVMIKSLVNAPADLIFALDVPSGVTVRVSTNATAVDAALLTA